MNVTIDDLEIRNVTLPPIANTISATLIVAMMVYIVASIVRLMAGCQPAPAYAAPPPAYDYDGHQPTAPLMGDTTL